MSEAKKTKSAGGTKKPKKTKTEDLGYTRIDMSTMEPVSGRPIVLFRRIHG